MVKNIIIVMLFCLVFFTGCQKDDKTVDPAERLMLVPATEDTETSPSVPVREQADETTYDSKDTDKMISDDTIVAVKDYIPEIVTELKYSTSDNFTGTAIYTFEDAYLRYGTVKKLAAVQAALSPMGLRLKLWDAFRPASAQFKLWEIYPDPTYVANPNKGFSNHTRGNAVDVTLVDADGRELEMPSGFDDFSSRCDRDYSECSNPVKENIQLLEKLMEENGFSGYYGEWWHYADSVRYEPEVCFDPGLFSRWYADCNEFISLRETPDVTGNRITKISKQEEVTLLGYDGDFSYVDYQGTRGYVLTSYLKRLPEGGE